MNPLSTCIACKCGYEGPQNMLYKPPLIEVWCKRCKKQATTITDIDPGTLVFKDKEKGIIDHWESTQVDVEEFLSHLSL